MIEMTFEELKDYLNQVIDTNINLNISFNSDFYNDMSDLLVKDTVGKNDE